MTFTAKYANVQREQQEAQQQAFQQLADQFFKCTQTDGRVQDNPKPERQNRKYRPRAGQQNSDIECWHCKGKGHRRSDCTAWKQQQKNEKKAFQQVLGSA